MALLRQLFGSAIDCAQVIAARRGWVVASLIALVAASSASSAWAGCGDYVLIGGKPAHWSMFSPASGPHRLVSDPHAADVRPFSRPCQGPECGRLPVQAPPAAPAPVSPFESSPAAVLVACNSFSIFGCHRMLAGPAEEPAQGFPPRVERPPRTVAIVS